MEEKIITFVSKFLTSLQEREYDYPERGDAPHIKGILTNDAPMCYLLKQMQPSEVILLCTQDVRTQKRNGYADEKSQQGVPFWQGERTAEQHIRTVISEYCAENGIHTPDISVLDYDVNEHGIESALDGLLQRIGNDKIGLDVTGGPRDVNFLMVLLMQAMSYKGCKISHMVYSSINNGNAIYRWTNMQRLFGLINGMHEMNKFGSTATLRELLSNHPGTPAYRMVDVIGRLFDALTLCQMDMDTLRYYLEEYRAASAECEQSSGLDAELDPLFRSLLRAFNKKMKFAQQDMSLPGILNWCVSNRMLQQALTIYNELMPDWLVEQGFITVDEDEAWHENVQQDSNREYFKAFSMSMLRDPRNPPAYIRTELKHSLLVDLAYDFQWVMRLRNVVNHSAEMKEGWARAKLERHNRSCDLSSVDAVRSLTNKLNQLVQRLRSLEDRKRSTGT